MTAMAPIAALLAAPAVAVVLSVVDDGTVKQGMDMMEDGPSLLLFAGVVAVISVAAVLALPPILNRMGLRRAVPALALIGPVLGLLGALVGGIALAMTGRDVGYSLIISIATGVAATLVGLRLANPMAKDLDVIGSTVERVATGDRSARTGIDRTDEVGNLAAAVDNLTRSLGEAERAREISDEERNAVVSALSHDLRTPLASLLVVIEALQDGLGDPVSHLKAMRGNVLALEHLVEDLFLLARADSGRLALTMEPLDLGELLDGAVEALGPVAAAASVDLRTDLVEPLIVAGDDTALGRVFRNLLDNAIRHSPPGGSVSIRHSKGATRVRVTVSDEGPGFDPEFVSRALERFSQADDARSRQGAAGLGLAIANTLVDAHGGVVEVEPGPGARVTVELPLVSIDDRSTDRARA